MVRDHPWVKLVVDTLERNGTIKPHYFLESPTEPVGVVALTADNHLLVTRHYRHPVGHIIYDLLGGGTYPGEDLIVAAKRELKEETGYTAGRIESLGTITPFPGSLRVALNLFIATDLVQGTQQLDPGEELEVHHLPFDEVYAAVLAGSYIDGALQIGVLLARAKGYILSKWQTLKIPITAASSGVLRDFAPAGTGLFEYSIRASPARAYSSGLSSPQQAAKHSG